MNFDIFANFSAIKAVALHWTLAWQWLLNLALRLQTTQKYGKKYWKKVLQYFFISIANDPEQFVLSQGFPTGE